MQRKWSETLADIHLCSQAAPGRRRCCQSRETTRRNIVVEPLAPDNDTIGQHICGHIPGTLAQEIGGRDPNLANRAARGAAQGAESQTGQVRADGCRSRRRCVAVLQIRVADQIESVVTLAADVSGGTTSIRLSTALWFRVEFAVKVVNKSPDPGAARRGSAVIAATKPVPTAARAGSRRCQCREVEWRNLLRHPDRHGSHPDPRSVSRWKIAGAPGDRLMRVAAVIAHCFVIQVGIHVFHLQG